MGVNRFVGRNRGSRRYSRKTGKRRYAGAKKLKRVARRAKYRRSAAAQSRQIRKIAGSLAATKGTHTRSSRGIVKRRSTRGFWAPFKDLASYAYDAAGNVFPSKFAMETAILGAGLQAAFDAHPAVQMARQFGLDPYQMAWQYVRGQLDLYGARLPQ